jgi:uncharacterized protein YdiU (UPF0061 family)
MRIIRDFLNLELEQDFLRLPSAFFAQVQAQGLEKAELVAVSSTCADLLGIDPESLSKSESLAILSANNDFPGIASIAMKYTGHQFGYYNPDLGDGRGLLLADVKTDQSIRWDLHLKGAGMTPFSRHADGRAVLRSSIREFLASEAMAALGIPTTRALCVVNSKTPVYREQVETAATVLRVTQSHIRFGHFEYAYHTKQKYLLQELADYCIERYYPCSMGNTSRYADFFRITVRKTAKMIAKWQAFGFAHGVMNTDNMSILGETFDYGPYGFLDAFEPGYICNHSDHQGRYAFDKQPGIAHWNLSVLAQALSPLIPKDALVDALQSFNDIFNADYLSLMSAKFGFYTCQENDQQLIHRCLMMMAENRLDYTFFFRKLSGLNDSSVQSLLRDLCINRDSFNVCIKEIMQRWQLEGISETERSESMNAVNPKYILRNYLAQQAIEQAQQGDYSEVQFIYELLQKPFDEQSEHHAYSDLPPDWAKQLEISCSS